jgi:hypothetical protein
VPMRMSLFDSDAPDETFGPSVGVSSVMRSTAD